MKKKKRKRKGKRGGRLPRLHTYKMQCQNIQRAFVKIFKEHCRYCTIYILKNVGWGECRDVTRTKLQCQNIQRALQALYNEKKIGGGSDKNPQPSQVI